LLIGAGWRSRYFLHAAKCFPDRLRVSAVVARRPERASEISASWEVPTLLSLDDALSKERPDFVIVSVPWPATPGYLRQLVQLELPVLTETPPAPDLPGLRALWNDIGSLGLVQVCEQYHRYPSHAARFALIAQGKIGKVTEVHLSSSHQYHVTSLMRRYLGTGFEPVTVTGFSSVNPLVDPIDPAGWREDLEAKPVSTVMARFDFASGAVGMYEFTDNQWWNPLREDWVLVRGSHGEIHDDRVTRLIGPRAVTRTHLERRQTGLDMNLEGFDLEHIAYGDQIVYRNDWLGGRLSDDELAVASMMMASGEWARAGAGPGGPYPLAEACQDHALALAIDESITQGRPVRLAEQIWSS
jgi:predicted dehydrogenase